MIKWEPTSLAESVYSELRNKIISENLKPGDRLKEQAISEEMGVSRTPIRDAIKRLADERLVEIVPRCGARVIPIQKDDVEQLYDVLLNLEEQAIRGALLHAKSADISKLRTALVKLRGLTGLENIVEADVAFHGIICDICDNEILTPLFDYAVDRGLRYRREYFKKLDNPAELVKTYGDFIDAMEQGDETLAVITMKRFLREQQKVILA